MKITRINKIKDHRAFSDFEWRDLHDFGRFNVIYGWNGSGKTTLSNLFRHIQMQAPISEGQVEFHIDGKAVLGSALATGTILPRIRVFNRDFISSSVGMSAFSPIFFLGADSVAKQKEIDELKKKRDETNTVIENKDRESRSADTALDKLCVSGATTVRELLKSSGQNHFNNYDKGHFRKACLAQAKPEAASMLLDEKAKEALKKKKEGTPKDKIGDFPLTIPDFHSDFTKSALLFKTTVVSKVIQELTQNAPLAEWVQSGLKHHTGEHSSKECHFCGSPLPQDRLTSLEAHFNDAYKRFLEEIDTAIQGIEANEDALSSIAWPGKTEFYSHLVPEFIKAKNNVVNELKPILEFMKALREALLKKRQQPFESLEVNQLIPNASTPPTEALADAIKAVQSLIQTHNKETDDFQSEVINAREALEKCLVAEALADFKAASAKIKTLKEEHKAAETQKKDFEENITSLEREIVEHQRPAEQLNEELKSYLGRGDLTFTVKSAEPGYEITRNGQIATNLSEGERTAIAFLYFLKSLQDKNFTLSTDIVVIDDPVSSLDANALFCAFGYMKARTREAGQIFILTHNFGFFRQVKNWFHHLSNQDKKEARFFMLQTSESNGLRNCSLIPLDPLLREYESEYHYLFKTVYTEANKPVGQQTLETYYSVPNLARRLLESFLAFRYPLECGHLYKQLERVDATFDAGKKTRILRFLHSYSHDEAVGETNHDLSLLAETPQVLKELIELLKHQDIKHFEEMEKIVQSHNSQSNVTPQPSNVYPLKAKS